MVDMGDSKVQRRHEDDLARGNLRQEVQRDDRGAEDDFLSDWALLNVRIVLNKHRTQIDLQRRSSSTQSIPIETLKSCFV